MFNIETNTSLREKCGTRVIINDISCIQPITNKADFDNAVIYSKTKSNRIKSIIKWESVSDESETTNSDVNDKLLDLKKHLLEFAGDTVNLPDYEEDIDNIMDYGQFWIGNNIKMSKGLPSQCHYNASRLWEQNKDVCRICTGYALSSDGIWRQHSWLIWMKSRSNQIVETTLPRIAYFGFVMTHEQCAEFAYENL